MTKPNRKIPVKKNYLKKRNGGKGRARADRVLAQGTGKTVSKAFGSTGGAGLSGWDAFSPVHLPLPRSVGPYTVVRTTSMFTSSERFNLIGCFRHREIYASTGHTNSDYWSNIGMLTSRDAGLPINDTANNGNALLHTIPFPGSKGQNATGFTAVPSAISVQVMNPNPLQTTQGIVAGTVCSTQLDLRGRSDTWAELSNEVISFMKPRLMSAGKLSLRGIQADSYPLNMGALADFLPVGDVTDGVVTMSANTFDGRPQGFAPIVIINEANTHPMLSLNFLVTVEWRVRFDISNPAVSSHVHHGITTDGHWDRLIRGAVARGNGICDIAERVASAGVPLARMAGTAYQAYRAVQPLAALGA